MDVSGGLRVLTSWSCGVCVGSPGGDKWDPGTPVDKTCCVTTESRTLGRNIFDGWEQWELIPHMYLLLVLEGINHRHSCQESNTKQLVLVEP